MYPLSVPLRRHEGANACVAHIPDTCLTLFQVSYREATNIFNIPLLHCFCMTVLTCFFVHGMKCTMYIAVRVAQIYVLFLIIEYDLYCNYKVATMGES